MLLRFYDFMISKHAIIYTDGGARGNPGLAGVGVVIQMDNETKTFKKFIGHATNNQAEYQAVILALQKAKDLGLENLDFILDSELIVNQLNQKYKVKNQELGSLFVKAWNLMQEFKKVTFRHVLRGQNKEADRLVNEAIDDN